MRMFKHITTSSLDIYENCFLYTNFSVFWSTQHSQIIPNAQQTYKYSIVTFNLPELTNIQKTLVTVVNANYVDYLLQRTFQSLPFEEKHEMKRLMAHQVRNIVIKQPACKNNTI